MTYYDERYPDPKAKAEAPEPLPPAMTKTGLEIDADDAEFVEELLGLTDEEVEEARKKTPEPALIRGGIMAVVGLAAYIVGAQIDTAWVDPVVDIYAVAAPIGLAWWIRRNVTPVGKHRK
ncbi:membrane protein [Mycobacterium phage Eaglepride]|nr:membrane protein [Mycobacterium phage Eaglepride]